LIPLPIALVLFRPLASGRFHCATDRNEGPLHGTRPLFATASRTGTFMSTSSISFGLLVALFVILLLYRMRTLKPQIAGFGSQRMCPFCGFITSRLKACCLECGQSLTAVNVI